MRGSFGAIVTGVPPEELELELEELELLLEEELEYDELDDELDDDELEDDELEDDPPELELPPHPIKVNSAITNPKAKPIRLARKEFFCDIGEPETLGLIYHT